MYYLRTHIDKNLYIDCYTIDYMLGLSVKNLCIISIMIAIPGHGSGISQIRLDRYLGPLSREKKLSKRKMDISRKMHFSKKCIFQ